LEYIHFMEIDQVKLSGGLFTAEFD
jgi:hypothetical protein